MLWGVFLGTQLFSHLSGHVHACDSNGVVSSSSRMTKVRLTAKPVVMNILQSALGTPCKWFTAPFVCNEECNFLILALPYYVDLTSIGGLGSLLRYYPCCHRADTTESMLSKRGFLVLNCSYTNVMGRTIPSTTQMVLSQISELRGLYGMLRRNDQLILDSFFEARSAWQWSHDPAKSLTAGLQSLRPTASGSL